MAREIDRLKSNVVDKLKTPGMHPDGGGLYLQIRKSQGGGVTRSWIFRYSIGKRAKLDKQGNPVLDDEGKPIMVQRARDLGLGTLSTWSLAEARDEAKKRRQLLDQGIDPIEHRDEKRNNIPTFAEASRQFIEGRRARWSNPSHTAQWTTTLETHVFPVLGNMPVNTIELEHVAKVLGPIWKTRTETASRIRGRIEGILDWCTVMKWRKGDNPARWKGNLEHLPELAAVKTVNPHPALPYKELSAFMARLRDQRGNPARCLEFTVLTCARTQESLGACWEEIEGNLWTVPASRMKTRKEHRVPLSPEVMALLESLPHNESGYLFEGRSKGKPCSSLAMVLKRMGRSDITVHGMRSTFRDWGAEITNYPPYLLEAALTHTIQNTVQAAYERGDKLQKRRHVMDSWARYATASKAKVVKIA